MTILLSTKEVAEFLNVNEKMVYSLVSEKKLPASKVTGKWLFPKHLVEQWIETNTLNYPDTVDSLEMFNGLLVIAGSNDLLLEKAISLYNTKYSDKMIVFANIGSMGGLKALRRKMCHIASSHLLQYGKEEYNFDFAGKELEKMPVVVNFCMREQGIVVRKGNSKKINGIKDLARKNVTIINRPIGTGTRLLFDQELNKAGIQSKDVKGYENVIEKHMDVGLEVLAGKADAGVCIRPVASVLDLEFLPIRWERYDLLIKKDRFFDKDIQNFLGIFHEAPFEKAAERYEGYDITKSGRMLFQNENESINI